jgi:hypothetical protein
MERGKIESTGVYSLPALADKGKNTGCKLVKEETAVE